MRKSLETDPKNTKDPKREPIIFGPVVGIIDGTWSIQERNILRQVATEEVFLADRTLPHVNWNERPRRQMSPCVLQELMKAGFFGVPGSAQVVALQNLLRPCCRDSRYTGCGWSGGFINILLRNEPWFVDMIRTFMGAPIDLEEARLDRINKNRMKYAGGSKKSNGTINKFVFYRNNFNNCSMATEVVTFILRQSDDELGYVGITSVPGTSPRRNRSTQPVKEAGSAPKTKKAGRPKSKKTELASDPASDLAANPISASDRASGAQADPITETHPKGACKNRTVSPSLDHLPFFAHDTDYRMIHLSPDVLWKHLRPEWQNRYHALWAEKREERQAARKTYPNMPVETGVSPETDTRAARPGKSYPCSEGTPAPGHAVHTRYSMYFPRGAQEYFDTQATELRGRFGIGGVETPVDPGKYVSEYARVAAFAQRLTRLVHTMDVRLNMTPEILHTRAAAHRVALVSRLVPGMPTNARINRDDTGIPVQYFLSSAMAATQYKRILEFSSAGISEANFIEEDNAIGASTARSLGEMFYAILGPGKDTTKPKRQRASAAVRAAIKAEKAAAKAATAQSAADTEGNGRAAEPQAEVRAIRVDEMRVDRPTEDDAPEAGSHLEPVLEAVQPHGSIVPQCCIPQPAREILVVQTNLGPVTEATAEVTVEAIAEATAEATSESIAEATAEATSEAIAEVTVEAIPEATTDATAEAIPTAEKPVGVIEEAVDLTRSAAGSIGVTSPDTADSNDATCAPSSPPPVFSPAMTHDECQTPIVNIIDIEKYYAGMYYTDARHPSPSSESSSDRQGRPAKRRRKSAPESRVSPTRATIQAAERRVSKQHTRDGTCRYCFLAPFGDDSFKEDPASLTSSIISGALSGTQERLNELRARIDSLEDHKYVVPSGHENCANLAAAIRGLDLSVSVQPPDSHVGGVDFKAVNTVNPEPVNTVSPEADPSAPLPPPQTYLDPMYNPEYAPSATYVPSATSALPMTPTLTVTSAPPAIYVPPATYAPPAAYMSAEHVPATLPALPVPTDTLPALPVPIAPSVPPTTPQNRFYSRTPVCSPPASKSPSKTPENPWNGTNRKTRKRMPAKPRTSAPKKTRTVVTPIRPQNVALVEIKAKEADEVPPDGPLTYVPLSTALSDRFGDANGRTPHTPQYPKLLRLAPLVLKPVHPPASLKRPRSVSPLGPASHLHSVSPMHSTIALPDVDQLRPAPAMPPESIPSGSPKSLITTNVGLTAYELAQAQHEAFFAESEPAPVAPGIAMYNGAVYGAEALGVASLDRAVQDFIGAGSETFVRAGASSLFENVAAPTQLSACGYFRASTPSAPENTHSTLLMYCDGPDDALNDLYGASSPFVTRNDDLFSSRPNSPANDSQRTADGNATSLPPQSGATSSDAGTLGTVTGGALSLCTDSLPSSPSQTDLDSPTSFDSAMSFFDETPPAETDVNLTEGRCAAGLGPTNA